MLQTLKKSPIWLLALLFALLSIFYWGMFVKERYVSSANVVLQSPSIAPPSLDFSSMLSSGAANNTEDLLYLREYLMSVDVLKTLNRKLDIKQHYAQEHIDWVNRLDPKAPIETFHEYFLSRVSIEMDSYSNVLGVSASAYNPKMAQQIVSTLLKLGEQHMNQMGQRLAQEQVNFIETQVDDLAQKHEQAQQALLRYQDKQGLISPTQSTESLAQVVTQLNTQLIQLQAEYRALSATQSKRSSQMIQLKNQIKAMQAQIQSERGKLTGKTAQSLNRISADYSALLLKEQFAREIYSNALATLESTRVEASRKLKQVSVLQSPSMPEYATDPDRLYNITVSIIIILLISIIVGLFSAVIKDHKD